MAGVPVQFAVLSEFCRKANIFLSDKTRIAWLISSLLPPGYSVVKTLLMPA